MKWNDPKKIMPDIGQPVLVVAKDLASGRETTFEDYPMYYDGTEWKGSDGWFWLMPHEIIAWRPLPKREGFNE